jgi:hypothetical protein
MDMTKAKRIARTIGKAKSRREKAKRVHKWVEAIKEALAG